MLKKLPNILSCLRIALSVALLFLMGKPSLFLTAYILCGASDIADGYIARKYNAQTKLGAKLDSLGDFVFFGIALFLSFTLIGKGALTPLILVVISASAIRAANLIITRVKYRQWSVMHTISNKTTGLALFASLPVCVVIGYIPMIAVLIVGGLSALSALEETVILLTTANYDANRKSIFWGPR